MIQIGSRDVLCASINFSVLFETENITFYEAQEALKSDLLTGGLFAHVVVVMAVCWEYKRFFIYFKYLKSCLLVYL